MDPIRDETAAERYDRNWIDLIQEVRVAQTGIQVLAGFLLTIGLMVAPVAIHRFLFDRRQKDILVRVGDRMAKLGLVALGLTLVAVTTLIFDVVLSAVAGVVAGLVMLLFYTLIWAALPMSLQRYAGRY